MQVVIDIPDEMYEVYHKQPPMLGDSGIDSIVQAIAKGTPLDKTDNSVLEQLKDEIQEKGFNSHLMNPVFTMTEILEMIDKHIYGVMEECIDADRD